MHKDLIEASEFGDWLLGQMAQAARRSRGTDTDQACSACERLLHLKVAKKLLLEFLLLQQSMLEAASALHRCRNQPEQADGLASAPRQPGQV